MKNFTLIAVLALLSFSNIQAQPQKSGWHDRMMSEKIAFITMELQLTPEEAQAFWPVYNQIAQEKKASQKAMMTAYRTMVKALEEGTASDKEISAMLDDYLAAKQAHKEAGKDDADRYRKVLPAKKVVKLILQRRTSAASTSATSKADTRALAQQDALHRVETDPAVRHRARVVESRE